MRQATHSYNTHPGLAAASAMLVLVLGVALSSPLCPRGLQYWNTHQQTCANCSTCEDGQVVLRPCQPHTDTYCGPLAALRIDWSWLRPKKQVSSSTPASSVAPRAVQQPAVRKKVAARSTTTSSTTDAPVTTEEPVTRTLQVTTLVEEKVSDVSITLQPPSPSPQSSTSPPRIPPRPVVSAQPFSAAETLVWDWQAFTLVAAVTSCAIFLLLLAAYAVYQARSATGRRRNLQRELDEATAHLSLFTAGPGDHMSMSSADLPRPPEQPGVYNQCLYLEKLLERKQQRQNERGRGNIYVETGRQATPAPSRRSMRWKARQSNSLR